MLQWDCGPPYQNVYMTYLQNWDKYNVVVIIYSHIIHTNTHTCLLTLHSYASSNRGETKNAELHLVKKDKNLAQQKLPDRSEKGKCTGIGAARYGNGKALTPISSSTRRVLTHMLCSYSRLNWPLADGNGACDRAFSVIPFSSRFASYHMHTILIAGTFTSFEFAPIHKISLLWAAIKPIKFVISFPMQPNPSIAFAASVSQQVVNKLVFLF